MKNKNKDQNKFFYGDPALMQEFIDKNIKHYDDDSLVQGNYKKEKKGCFLFCCAVDKTTKKEVIDKLRINKNVEKQAILQEIIIKKYNLPKWLLYFLEVIFEGLPISDARQFFKDLQEHWHCNEEGFLKNKLLLFILTDPDHGLLQYADTYNSSKPITDLAELQRRIIAYKSISREEWSAVEWATTVETIGLAVAVRATTGLAGLAKWTAIKEQLFKLLDEAK